MKLGLKAYKSLLAMSMLTREWVLSAIHDIGGHLLAEYRPFQTTNIMRDGKDNENKITLEIQKVQKEGDSTERALAAEIACYRRATRSHSDLPGKVIGK